MCVRYFLAGRSLLIDAMGSKICELLQKQAADIFSSKLFK
jgi:hypothetical protein